MVSAVHDGDTAVFHLLWRHVCGRDTELAGSSGRLQQSLPHHEFVCRFHHSCTSMPPVTGATVRLAVDSTLRLLLYTAKLVVSRDLYLTMNLSAALAIPAPECLFFLNHRISSSQHKCSCFVHYCALFCPSILCLNSIMPFVILTLNR